MVGSFLPLIFLCLPAGMTAMRKLYSCRKLRDGFGFRKTLVRHRKFPKTVLVSGETDRLAIGYGKTRNARPPGKNGKNARKIALPVKRCGCPTTE
jgi:hypothetical protein